MKFGRLLDRAQTMGFDAIATGHHARDRARRRRPARCCMRGADQAKDQSYVLYMLERDELAQRAAPGR